MPHPEKTYLIVLYIVLLLTKKSDADIPQALACVMK
jgi:hypothetical protein